MMKSTTRSLRFAAIALVLMARVVFASIRPAIALSPTQTVISDCSNDTELRAAVLAGGAIVFDCGMASIPISGYMEVSEATVIDGASRITLNGGGSSAFFQVFSSANLTLRNLTLRNGRAADARPLEIFGEATLEQVNVVNNQTGSNGGAATVYGKLTVRNSKFEANTAASATGFATGGAAILVDGGNAAVWNSNFTTNSVGGNFGNGGAISVRNGWLSVTGSTFSDNYAFDGGALYIASGTQVTVTQSIFSNNSARYGGAIENSGQLQLDGSTLTGNLALGGDGGAIWSLSGDVDVTFSTLSENEAATTGGAVSCYGNALSVINSTLNGNIAGTDGGGIYSTCDVNLTNSTLTGNTAPSGGGGGLFQQAVGAANVAYVTLANNSANMGGGVANDASGGLNSIVVAMTLLANNAPGNCAGAVVSLGYNASSDDTCSGLNQTGDEQNAALALGPLANNGGSTRTRLLLDGNAALDAIPAAACGFSSDQRDFPRPFGPACDIGAVEMGAGRMHFLPRLQRVASQP